MPAKKTTAKKKPANKQHDMRAASLVRMAKHARLFARGHADWGARSALMDVGRIFDAEAKRLRAMR